MTWALRNFVSQTTNPKNKTSYFRPTCRRTYSTCVWLRMMRLVDVIIPKQAKAKPRCHVIFLSLPLHCCFLYLMMIRIQFQIGRRKIHLKWHGKTKFKKATAVLILRLTVNFAFCSLRNSIHNIRFHMGKVDDRLIASFNAYAQNPEESVLKFLH